MLKLTRTLIITNLCLAAIAQTPSLLFATIPIELEMLSGLEMDTPTDDVWYTTYKGYKLTKVRMWKNSYYTSGFEVTFSPPSSHLGWPDETHMFGFTTVTDNYSEITISNDIVKVNVCVDGTATSDTSDFEGLEFELADGTLQRISPTCNPWTSYDVGGGLIGFHARTGLSYQMGENIRSIAVITDYDCSQHAPF